MRPTRLLSLGLLLLLFAGCVSSPSEEDAETLGALAASPLYAAFVQAPRFAPRPSEEGIWLKARGWKARIRPNADGATVEYGERDPRGSLGYRVGSLTAENYAALWEDLDLRGVWSLPTNVLSEWKDPYVCGVTLCVQRGDRSLVHLRARGCRVTRSEFMPSADEKERFNAFLESIRYLASSAATKIDDPPPAWDPVVGF